MNTSYRAHKGPPGRRAGIQLRSRIIVLVWTLRGSAVAPKKKLRVIKREYSCPTAEIIGFTPRTVPGCGTDGKPFCNFFFVCFSPFGSCGVGQGAVA